jgi:hypothetical protein
MTYTVPDFGPNDLLTSAKEGERRIKTQEGSDAFSAGRAFRLPYEYAVGATPTVLRFTSPVPFNLTEQLLTCDAGNVRFDAYRNGIESGSWTDVMVFARNLVDNPDYVRSVTVETGGAFDPDGNPSADKIRLRTSGSTAQRSTASSPLRGKRRLAPGTYYLVLSRIDGNDEARGIYLIEWEELTE